MDDQEAIRRLAELRAKAPRSDDADSVQASIRSLGRRISEKLAEREGGDDVTERLRKQSERDRRRDLWRAAGFPTRHVQAIEKDEVVWPYPAYQAYIAVADVVAAGGLCAMVGPRGTGKTQMGTSISRSAVMNDGLSAVYWRTADLIADFRTRTYTAGESENTALKRLSAIGLIVLDEYQERRNTADEDTIITRLLDHRYADKHATILIANLRPDKLIESLGPSVADRLRETGEIVECVWDSYRSKA
jgi:DNA replication protein DnaC